ncbi:DUF1080 domain-containing protein [Roseibacillus persicicus]|uniref:3-keto-disaccharide hydrolase n=1 Tax=Roseibacillus persicicus TaxID=454148 RepID=UPI00398B7F88
MKDNQIAKSVSVSIGAVILAALGSLSAGEIAESQQEWFERYQKQVNAPEPASMLLNQTPEPDLETGYVDLFNGVDLTGWTSRQGKASFEAKDGVIMGTAVPGTPSTYLCTERDDYQDFVFTCEVKWIENLNTGVMFRAQVRETEKLAEEVYGPQVEMEGVKGERHWSGGIYGQSCGGYYYPVWLKEHEEARKAIKREGWNRVTVEAKGKVVKTWLNGVPIAHWVGDGTFAEGFLGLQVHKAKSGQVAFRNIRVKELP